MNLHEDLKKFLSEVNTNFKAELLDRSGCIVFQNSGKRGLKAFEASLDSFISAIGDIRSNIAEFAKISTYEESNWREAGSTYFNNLAMNSIVQVQTKPIFATLAKLIGWGCGKEAKDVSDDVIELDVVNIDTALRRLDNLASLYDPVRENPSKTKVQSISISKNIEIALVKPFLLLAGISGTGKSRFVRKQAEASGDGKSNFKLVCVRPDWHEPADLLGYVSRIGGQPEYVATDVLRFMAAAWREAFDGADDAGLLAKEDALTPYWLCLDEMNLAPVEQYFADYLSVLETRQWDDGVYRCEALLTAAVIGQLEEVGRNKLRKALALDAPEWDDLWQAFCTHGMPLPPNLIVAGTVNMDETTHGFSRKVIDRAITLDFGEFFPNDFDTFFGDQPLPVTLGYPRFTSVTQADFAAVAADSDGSKTVAFLKAVNLVLAGTPFELAYRALNELLLAVVLAKPADDKALQAVWDDFLMTKVLPRIDGDEERLAWRAAANPENTDKTVLDGLLDTARSQLAAITGEAGRPDLLRTAPDGQPRMVAGRSLKKLGWMQQRLMANRFTSFWP